MSIVKQTSKEYFRSTLVLYYALMMGLVISFIVVLLLGVTILKPMVDQDIKNILFAFTAVAALGGLLASHYLFKQRLKAIKEKQILTEKMADYRSALVIKWALVEAPVFTALIFCFITCDPIFLGIALAIIIYFSTLKPSKERAIKELELSLGEEQQVNNPEAIIAEIVDER